MFNKISPKKLVILAICLLTLLTLAGGLIWVKNHGIIEIEITSADKQELDYRFVNQVSGNTVSGKFTGPTLKKVLPTGDYEIFITTNVASLISAEKAGSFLSTKTISGALTSEKGRAFIGYNPSPCSALIADVLYSFECSGEIENIVKHIPANQSTPTYTSIIKRSPATPINGIASTKFGTIIFTDAVFKSDTDLESNYTVGLLNDDFIVTNIRTVDEIGLGIKYRITAFKEGFLIYSRESNIAFYYKSLGAQPIEISLQKTRLTGNLENGIEAAASSIFTFSSTETAGGTEEDTDVIDQNTKSELTVHTDSATNSYSLVGKISKALPCATKLCVLYSNKQLRVYETGDKILRETASFRDISDIYQFNGQIKLVSTSGIIDYSAGRKSNFYDYSFGKYRYCGIQENISGYTLCLVDAKNNRVALALNTNSNVTTPADKLVFKLQESPKIIDVSLYKNILFVTPKVRSGTDSQSNQGTYSAKEIKQSNEIVTREIKTSGLTASQLTIINTVDPF